MRRLELFPIIKKRKGLKQTVSRLIKSRSTIVLFFVVLNLMNCFGETIDKTNYRLEINRNNFPTYTVATTVQINGEDSTIHKYISDTPRFKKEKKTRKFERKMTDSEVRQLGSILEYINFTEIPEEVGKIYDLDERENFTLSYNTKNEQKTKTISTFGVSIYSLEYDYIQQLMFIKNYINSLVYYRKDGKISYWK